MTALEQLLAEIRVDAEAYFTASCPDLTKEQLRELIETAVEGQRLLICGSYACKHGCRLHERNHDAPGECLV